MSWREIYIAWWLRILGNYPRAPQGLICDEYRSGDNASQSIPVSGGQREQQLPWFNMSYLLTYTELLEITNGFMNNFFISSKRTETPELLRHSNAKCVKSLWVGHLLRRCVYCSWLLWKQASHSVIWIGDVIELWKTSRVQNVSSQLVRGINSADKMSSRWGSISTKHAMLYHCLCL